jgi:casein kinase 1
MENRQEEDKLNNCILNKYLIDKLIGNGHFGNIFKGRVIKTNEIIAIKIEKKELLTLKHEAIVLNYLYEKSVQNIPKIYWYGKHCNFNCLIIPYYNYCLFDYILLFSEVVNNNFIINIMIKMITLLKTIHECHVIHRDIKPQNFMIDKYNNVILIDFGMAEFYIEEKERETKKGTEGELHIVGTPKFMSVYNHDGFSSYRDDLISIGYICLWMLNKQLPWDHHCSQIENDYKNQNLKNQKNIFLNNFKESMKNENEPNILLRVICKYLVYCHKLNYNSFPHYNELVKIFEKIKL